MLHIGRDRHLTLLTLNPFHSSTSCQIYNVKKQQQQNNKTTYKEQYVWSQTHLGVCV